MTASPRLLARLITAAALGLVCVRAAVFVIFGYSHFDSDQATLGLMAKHLAELRSFPFYFYGQKYLLALSAWAAAPAVALFGLKIAALKAPLLLMNLVVAIFLLRFLVRESRLSPPQAFVATGFFTLAPVIPASRLVEFCGGNIEPFLFVLGIWALRRRPLALGLFSGVGFLNRPFVVYGLVALAFLGLIPLRAIGRFLAGLLGVLAAGSLIARFSTFYFGSEAPAFRVGLRLRDLHWLLSRNLATLLAARVDALKEFNIESTLSVGHPWTCGLALLVLAGIGIVTFGRAWATIGRDREAAGRAEFPLYLLMVGALSAAGYLFCSPLVRDVMLIRYDLLFLLFPVGATALLFQRSSRDARLACAACVLAWMALSLEDHVRLLLEATRRPPQSPTAELAAWLESRHVHCGSAPYWTAYTLDFFSDERLGIQSSQQIRIPTYRAQGPGCAQIVLDSDRPSCSNPQDVGHWRICL